MDFLNQLVHRIVGFWRDASLLGRSLLVGVCLLMGTFSVLAACWRPGDQYEVLFAGESLSSRELTAMEAALGKARLNGGRIVDGQLRVPRDKKDLYLKALDENNALPVGFYAHAERVVSQDSPFHSQKQREALWKLAKERELALMLRKMSGIDEASVQYDEVETNSFPRRRERRATVAVRATEGRPLDETRIRAIRRTVMNAVGVADAQRVTVLDLNAGHAYAGEDDDAQAAVLAASEQDYGIAKRKFEETYSEKIRQRLAMYSGVVVGVNVELDASGQVPRQVAASIGLPHSCLRSLWNRRGRVGLSAHGDPAQSLAWRRFEDETRRSVEAAVLPLMPVMSNADQRTVTVEVFADEIAVSRPTTEKTHDDALANAAVAGHVLSAAWSSSEWWSDHAPTLLGLVAGVLAIAWLCQTPRSHDSRVPDARGHELRGDEPRIAKHLDAITPNDDESSSEPVAPRSVRSDLRNEVTQRIQSDPQTAAKTLQHWLTSR